MMHDLRAGIVNCVIVKDLSRLGRNYVKVGEYLEHTFPLLNVRFIALSERIDSVADPRSADSLIVPFRNILNDEYAHDISNKSALRSISSADRANYRLICVLRLPQRPERPQPAAD